MNRRQLIQLTRDWRESRDEKMQSAFRTSGVVLVNPKTASVYGWKNKLRDPKHERPGMFAVDENNRVFVAVGGNDRYGAEYWKFVSESESFGSDFR